MRTTGYTTVSACTAIRRPCGPTRSGATTSRSLLWPRSWSGPSASGWLHRPARRDTPSSPWPTSRWAQRWTTWTSSTRWIDTTWRPSRPTRWPLQAPGARYPQSLRYRMARPRGDPLPAAHASPRRATATTAPRPPSRRTSSGPRPAGRLRPLPRLGPLPGACEATRSCWTATAATAMTEHRTARLATAALMAARAAQTDPRSPPPQPVRGNRHARRLAQMAPAVPRTSAYPTLPSRRASDRVFAADSPSRGRGRRPARRRRNWLPVTCRPLPRRRRRRLLAVLPLRAIRKRPGSCRPPSTSRWPRPPLWLWPTLRPNGPRRWAPAYSQTAQRWSRDRGRPRSCRPAVPWAPKGWYMAHCAW